MPPESLTLIERYGSFGLVVVIVLAAIVGIVLFLRYLKNDLIPRAFKYLEDKDAEHREHLKDRDAVCKQAAETAAAAVEDNKRLAGVIADLVVEVRRMKDETHEHRTT